VSILSRILTQWRKGNAVVESETTELQRLEQLGDALGLFGDESSSCRWDLGRSEVADPLGGSVDVVGLFFDISLDCVVGRPGNSVSLSS
jgi:hypothetical protein